MLRSVVASAFAVPARDPHRQPRIAAAALASRASGCRPPNDSRPTAAAAASSSTPRSTIPSASLTGRCFSSSSRVILGNALRTCAAVHLPSVRIPSKSGRLLASNNGSIDVPW